MKKLMIAAAIVCAAVVSQAASFKWSASNIYAPGDASTLYNGTAKLYCDAIGADPLSTASIVDGAIATTTFSNDAFVVDDGVTKYTFYFVVEDGDPTKYVYTSNTKTSAAQDQTTPSLSFLSQKTNTQLAIDSDPKAWQSVPEPTSGLLLLLGVAGLALKRRRA